MHGPLTEEEHYYPFGLTMSGISDQALGFGKVNKYRFQKQELQNKEFDDGSGLDMYEFKYRFDDPQIGRFWSIDPLASDYEYNSPYAFSEDKVTSHIELEGLEAEYAMYSGFQAFTGALLGTASADYNKLPPPSVGIGNMDNLRSSPEFQNMAAGPNGFQIVGAFLANLFNKAVNNTEGNSGNQNSQQSQPPNNQGSGQGRGSNNRKPDPTAEGDHSVIDQNGSTTYQKNPQNPSGFQETERIDVKGGAHKNGAGIPVPTPHKHVKGQKEVQPLDPSKDVIPQYLPDIKPLPLPPPPPANNPKPTSS